MIYISKQPSLFGSKVTLQLFDNGLGVSVKEVEQVTKAKLLREKQRLLNAYCKVQVESITKKIKTPTANYRSLEAKLSLVKTEHYIDTITKEGLLSQIDQYIGTERNRAHRFTRKKMATIGKIIRYYEQLKGDDDVEESVAAEAMKPPL